MTLTVYTDDFDDEDSVSKGFSGKVFVEGKSHGKSFDSLSHSLKHIVENNIEIDEICFNYRDGKYQMYKRFDVNTNIAPQCGGRTSVSRGIV